MKTIKCFLMIFVIILFIDCKPNNIKKNDKLKQEVESLLDIRINQIEKANKEIDSLLKQTRKRNYDH